MAVHPLASRSHRGTGALMSASGGRWHHPAHASNPSRAHFELLVLTMKSALLAVLLVTRPINIMAATASVGYGK